MELVRMIILFSMSAPVLMVLIAYATSDEVKDSKNKRC